MEVEYRPTSRVALINEWGQMLLLKQRDDRTDFVEFWAAPGGMLDEGETWADAAIREVVEEVGIRVSVLYGPIWINRKQFRVANKIVDMDEQFFVAFEVSASISLAHRPSGEEGLRWLAARWWSAQDLCETTEIVFPHRMGSLLTNLLRRGVPVSPVDCGVAE